ncbi:MAG: amidohydrolase family protein [Proteobacteria bacterium]|nr:amidohydrolase family protein [Pseudomonadota bacterium]
MIRLLLVLVALLAASTAGAESWAITGARTWTMTSAAPVDNATIVIEEGRVVSVTAGGVPPKSARVVKADGRVVTPALVDAATQIGMGEVGGIADERGASVTKGPLGPAFEVQYAFDFADQAVRQARADGVAWATIYPDSSANAPFDGTAAIVHLGSRVAQVTRARSAMFATVGGGTAAAGIGSRAGSWQLLRNALEEARAYRPGAHGGSPRDQMLNHLDAEALAPVLAGTMPLVIATNRASDITQALALAREYRLRLVIFGGAEAWARADALAAAHVPVILDPMADLPDSYDTIGARRDNAAILARAGVPMAFSVSGQGVYRSWNAGPSMREGAGNAVAAGLPYNEALAAITSGAARVMGLDAKVGTLAPGADADLVIWDGDPLEPSSAPLQLYAAGEEVSLSTRQTMLRDRYAPRP